MRDLDETDMEIMTLLAGDARRPFADIGDEVGLSGPAVSERVKRLQESGVIQGFTINVDRSQLRAGVPVFVRVEVGDGDEAVLRERIGGEEAVEHVFVTADGDVWFYARAETGRVRRWLSTLLDGDAADYEVTLLDEVAWTPTIDGLEFALTCAECGNTVDSEGESARLGGDVYHFCCPSCASRFLERFERFEADA